MGGTTAKLCLIEDGGSRHGAETSRWPAATGSCRGSGLPLRIPVIDMVEIGAGGGSMAAVDDLARVPVGPECAGSEPGPACYGAGRGPALR